MRFILSKSLWVANLRMYKIILITLSFLVFSCGTSSTKVANTSEDVQTVMTLGVNKLNNTYNEDDSSKKVYVKIKGQIVLSEKCYFTTMNHSVELVKLNAKKPELFSIVNREKLTYELAARASDGDYSLNLVRTRDSKIIDSKKLQINSQNDKFTVNFNGCL